MLRMGQKTRLLDLCRIAATILKNTGFFALAGRARSDAATDTPISNLNRTSVMHQTHLSEDTQPKYSLRRISNLRFFG